MENKISQQFFVKLSKSQISLKLFQHLCRCYMHKVGVSILVNNPPEGERPYK